MIDRRNFYPHWWIKTKEAAMKQILKTLVETMTLPEDSYLEQDAEIRHRGYGRGSGRYGLASGSGSRPCPRNHACRSPPQNNSCSFFPIEGSMFIFAFISAICVIDLNLQRRAYHGLKVKSFKIVF